ncbi:Uncharacterised protein [Klebsiella variicola]|nr:Uncharacterised protein [Klebsiella variicola]
MLRNNIINMGVSLFLSNIILITKSHISNI